MISKDKICAGIVTYNSDESLLQDVLDAVKEQIDTVFIYDNNSKNFEKIEKISKNYKNVFVIHAKSNYGIAAALNALCEQAFIKEYKWILTLDHDTVIQKGMIKSFKEIVSRQDKIGIVCPRVQYINYSVKEKGNVNDRYTEVQACMTSGSLMLLEAWEKTGGFNEWMFIDMVDNDICMKLKLAGYRIIRDNKTFMKHNLGAPIKKKFFGISITDFQYSNLRIYYIVRNNIYFYKKYKKYMNRIKQFLIVIYQIIKLYIINIDNQDNRKTIVKAIKDGIKSDINKSEII